MNHNRLKCYEVLIKTAKRMPAIVKAMPKGESYMIDQMKRALASAILNLSEANGRTSPKERARYFDISLASMAETSAAVDILLAYGLIQISIGEEIKSDLRTAYAMLMGLKKAERLKKPCLQ